LIRKAGIAFTESFGYKLLKSFIAVIVILFSVFTAYSIFHTYRIVKDHLVHDGATTSALLAQSAKISLYAENHELLDNISAGILHHRDILFITIYNDKFNVLSDAFKPSYKKYADREEREIGKEILFKLTTPQSIETLETANTFEFVRPVFMELSPDIEEAIYFEKNEPTPKQKIIGYVRVVYDKSNLHHEMFSIIWRNILVALIFIVSSAVILYIATKKMMKPLNQLTEGVKKLGREEGYEKIPLSSNDEIGKLSAAFNEMAENLKAREEEKRDLEEHLAQAKRMEAIGTLARGIAHDFNNILGIIKGAVFVLTKKTGDDSNSQKYASVIDNSIKRARELIKALLVFSRTDTVQLDSLDLNAFIRDKEDVIMSGINESIQYASTLSDKPLIIMADRLKIEQVITNIVSNAVDAMPEGGRIHIKTEAVHISPDDTQTEAAKRPGDYACITISDTGAGMDEKTKERIFEPFFTTKEAGKGTGLGLSIVYGIIADHKGHIDVRTTEGEGTMFRIYLPLAR
jgi:signal transduction histidine kinase